MISKLSWKHQCFCTLIIQRYQSGFSDFVMSAFSIFHFTWIILKIIFCCKSGIKPMITYVPRLNLTICLVFKQYICEVLLDSVRVQLCQSQLVLAVYGCLVKCRCMYTYLPTYYFLQMLHKLDFLFLHVHNVLEFIVFTIGLYMCIQLSFLWKCLCHQ